MNVIYLEDFEAHLKKFSSSIKNFNKIENNSIVLIFDFPSSLEKYLESFSDLLKDGWSYVSNKCYLRIYFNLDKVAIKRKLKPSKKQLLYKYYEKVFWNAMNYYGDNLAYIAEQEYDSFEEGLEAFSSGSWSPSDDDKECAFIEALSAACFKGDYQDCWKYVKKSNLGHFI